MSDKVVKTITRYQFDHDRGKPGRDLETVKIGDVYVSKLTFDPGVVTGNIYHKRTSLFLFVASGTVRFKFVHIHTKQVMELVVKSDSGVIHVPPYVAIADKNIGNDQAVIIYFSDLPFRKDDDYEYKIY